MGRRTCARAASTCGWARRSRACACATGGSPASPSRRRRRSTADHYVAALPVEVHARAALARAARGRAAAQRARPAGHALDERAPCSTCDADLPLRQRPRDLHRLRVGADRRSPSASSGAASTSRSAATAASAASSRSTSRSGSAPGAAPARSPRRARREEICDEVWAQLRDHLDDARSTASTCTAGSSTRRSSSRTRRGATNLEPLLVNTAGSWADRPDAVTRDPEPLPGRRLRADLHRPGDDGGRQRGGAARGQRDPRRDRLAPRRAARSGRCASRPCSRRRGCWTGCAGSCSGAARAKAPLSVAPDGTVAPGAWWAAGYSWPARLCRR